MSAKIKDVAKKANVSIATVSRVINNVPLVNEETRDKVLQAIKETGYRPNAIARSLKLQKTETVGVVIDDITIHYYSQIARGVQDICMQNGYNTIICNSDADQRKEEAFVDLFYQKQCDGIIFAGRELKSSLVNKIDYLNIPIVMCGVDDENTKINCVVNDIENSIGELMGILASKGYNRLSAIMCDTAVDERSKKSREMLLEHAVKNGIEVDVIKEIPLQYNMKNGYDAAKEILQGKGAELLICENDEIAVGAKKAIAEKGLTIPGDIGIASLNLSEAGRWMTPELTGINNYMYDVGAISARMLVKILAGEKAKEKKVVVSYEIIEGESVR